jgi:glycosyltransferase involved in cell wall biosynthesis
MRVFLIEPYLTGSHQRWTEGYQRHSRHEVHVIGHEGHFWKWRLAGGFVTVAEEVERVMAAVGRPDVILATSMVDLAGLLGLLRRSLGDVPALLYMHENQITYPATGRTRTEAAHGLVCWGSLLAADGIAFNSQYHRDLLFESLPGFLRSFPDRRHGHLVDGVASKSRVLPVGADLRRLDPVPEPEGGCRLVLWNHRWDADKDPAAFLEAMAVLADRGVGFGLILAGERFVKQADEHADAVARLGERVEVAAYLADDEYRDALRRAAVVVSTARQEYFGVSVVEAMYARAFPVVPDRLVYPERIPRDLWGRCLYGSAQRLVDLVRRGIEEDTSEETWRLRGEAAAFDWSEVAPRYDDWLASG